MDITAVIYARFSSDKQTELSIEAQERACREYAVDKDMTISKVYVDEAISGKGSKTAARTQYQKMLRDAEKKQFDVVLIHKYDRIARNVGEHVNLEMKLNGLGIRLIATAQDFGSSKESKIMKTMMWALSEYYIDNLSEEVQKGHKEIALQGLHNGGYAPFGYNTINQEYEINEREAEFVRKAFDCAIHKQGFSALLKEMSDAGITGKRGKPIKYTQIYEILRNEKYTGTYLYSPAEEKNRGKRRSKPHAIRIENALPKIIDRAIFEEVQNIMDERKHAGRPSEYLCRGLVYCGNCGAKMYGSTTERKGHEYRIYSCADRCGIGTIRMDDVDNTVQNYLKELLSPDNLEAVNRALQNYAKSEKERIAEFNASIRKQLNEHQNQIDNYMNTLGSGALPSEVIADIGNKIVELKSEQKRLSELPIPKDYSAKQIMSWLESLRNSTDERKTVELLVERIDATKTEVRVTSTLASVLGNLGALPQKRYIHI